MKKILIAVCIILPLLFISCEKNFDVDIPEQEPRLVIGMQQATGEPFSAKISKSRGILAPTNASNPSASYEVTNALAYVFENNLLLDSLRFNSSERLYKSVNNKIMVPGRPYRIAVAAPGLNNVEASVTAPAAVPVASITRVQNARTSPSGEMLDDLTITFTDPSGETDYYLVRVLLTYSSSAPVEYNPVPCLYTSDVDIEKNPYETDPLDPNSCVGGELFMKDVNFNGRTKQIKLSIAHADLVPRIDFTNGREYKALFELWHISEPGYRYRKSVQAFENAADNPFAEPVQVYSNVQRGYGVFSIHSVARDSIR